MALHSQAEIEAMCEDLGGVPVSAGGFSTFALEDVVDEAHLDGQVVLGVTTLRFATGALPELGRGDAITVDGVEQRVRYRERVNDGAETQVFLYAPGTS